MAHAVEAEPTATESRSARCTLRRIATSGIAFAWIAVIIYAASNSIVSLLVGIGEANPVADDRNAITYHNLLLLGSLISAVPMAVMFRRDLTRASLRTLTRRDWGMLTLSAFLSSALTPGLFFFALANTTVTNVVLISRIEPPLFLLASWIVLNERFSRRTMCAGLIALTGAVVMIAMRDSGGLDDAMTAVASYGSSIYALAAGSNGLYRVDRDRGTAELVANLDLPTITDAGLAFDAEGTLWAVIDRSTDDAGNAVYDDSIILRIDAATGAFEEVATTRTGLESLAIASPGDCSLGTPAAAIPVGTPPALLILALLLAIVGVSTLRLRT